MMGSPQVYEMINELQEEELRRVSVHRIDALTHERESVRGAVASALVRLGMTLDRQAGMRTASSRIASTAPRREAPQVRPWDGETALHW